MTGLVSCFTCRCYISPERGLEQMQRFEELHKEHTVRFSEGLPDPLFDEVTEITKDEQVFRVPGTL